MVTKHTIDSIKDQEKTHLHTDDTQSETMITQFFSPFCNQSPQAPRLWDIIKIIQKHTIYCIAEWSPLITRVPKQKMQLLKYQG